MKGKARSIVSLQMCYMGWLYEIIATLFAVLSPTLHEYGMPNVYMADPILMFVVIPFVHLMNNEETKGIISEKNWFQGLQYVLGIYNETTHVSAIPQTNRSTPSGNSSSHLVISNTDKNNSIPDKKILFRRYNSAPKLFCSEASTLFKTSEPLRRINSLTKFISP